ncbi:MAG: hypothetical protein WC182_04605 [Bacilli bacterium]
MAFAGFTGNASVEFGADLDAGTYGLTNGTELTAEVTILELLVDKAGEGDIYAEISAELTFGFDFEDVAAGVVTPAGDVDITIAKIVGGNWYVSILGPMDAPDFAESAIDEDAGDDPVNLVAVAGTGGGVEVGFADYAFGLAIDNTSAFDGTVYDIFGAVATPEYALADGLTVKFGGAGVLASAGKKVSGSAKVAYATDDYSASLATDVIYTGAGLAAEVAVNSVFDPVTVDVYFANDAPASTHAVKKNLLSVKAAAADLAGFDVTVTGKDLINSQALSASAKYALTEELKVGVNGGYTIDGGAWEAGGDVAYTVADFTAKADVTYASAKTLEVNASIESTTLVDGATLSLGYENGDILSLKGAIKATATIAF